MESELLYELMKKYELTCSVIANMSDENILIIGEKESLKYQGLINNLFGDIDSVRRLDESLEGQLMPRVWGQGEITCIVCKPNKDNIIGIFYYENREPLESYKFSKELNKKIQEIWGICSK